MGSRNLFSKEWCNLIFEDRNKDYGAYQIRRNIGKRYAVALLLVFSTVAVILVVTIGIRLLMVKKVDNLMEDLRKTLPKMKTADAEMSHNVRLVTGGRRPSRMVAVEKGTTLVPEIVEVTKNEIKFGLDEYLDEQVGDFADEEIMATFEELDSVYEENQADLPVEGPALLPTEVVEEMPQFPGGITALMKWLDENVVYPQRCIKMKIGGELQVNFLVDVDGTLREPRIVYSLHPDLDRAVLNAIRRMPRWMPGKTNGKLTVVSVTLPVHFQPR